MAQMVSEVYDALRSVNVPEDKARKAAEALAVPDMGKVYDIRFDKIDSDIAVLKAEVAALKTDVTLMKWMLGIVLAMSAGILARLLFVH
jgi:hypothetical protein